MPSLYESTVNTGEVSSSNFTTLYNASGLAVPNAGAGSITGNLNVGGNLTVQGNSLLIGEVTLQSTLSLPNYTFPLPDGSTDQVLVTDGNGNLYWTDVNAIPGADYNISATPATGGANLTLANTAGITDSVRFASGTNIVVSRTDANTITISTIADNIPDGTAPGEVLVWDGSQWTANNEIRSTAVVDRMVAEFYSADKTISGAIRSRRNFASSPYVTNDTVSVAYQVSSDSQTPVTIGVAGFQYDAANPSFIAVTSTDNFVADRLAVARINSTTVGFDGTNLVLNNNLTGVPTENATFTVERGSSVNATLTWNETTDTWEFTNDALVAGDLAVNGGDLTTTNTTGNLFNANAVVVNIGNGATTEVNLGSLGAGRVQIKSPQLDVNGNATVQGIVNVNGPSVSINADNTAADSFLYMKGSTEYLKWNNTSSRFELSDQLYISETDIPAILERRSVTSQINTPLEYKSGLKLIQRITDAPNNDTLSAGAGISFARTSGDTDPNERLYGSLGAVWNGVASTVDWGLNWTNDNYTEPTPGNFPGTYTLLQAGSYRSKFYNDSLYVNYAAQGTTRTATSITGGNTLVFGSAHSYVVGERIQFTSTTQRGLIQNTYYYVLASGLTTTQCQLGLTSTGSAVALTNGTGLTLVFADMINRVGINTGNPLYTLDVSGEIRATGDIITSGITAGNITVGVATDNTISTTSGDLNITAGSASTVNITSNQATNPVTIVRDTAATNISVRALTLRTNSTGTPAVGLGASLDYEIETAANTYTRAGFVELVATDVTPGSEDFIMNFGVGAAGSFATRATLDGTGTLTLNNDLAVNGGDVTTTSGTGNLFNTNATTVNIGNGATTEVNIGSATGGSRVQIKPETIVGIAATQAVFNTVATTVNAFGAATNITMGVDGAVAGAGTTTIRSATTIVKGDLQVNGDNTGASADITTTKTTASVFDTNATTVNAFGAATTINIGAPTGTTTIDNDLTVNGVVNAEQLILDGRAVFDTTSITTTSTTTFTLDSTGRNAIKCMVYMQQGTESHLVEILIMRTSTDAMMTTYGEMYTTTPLATFTADQSGGSIRVRATPTSATSTTFSVVRYSLT